MLLLYIYLLNQPHLLINSPSFCSCYANAVLQCLMCTKPLMIYLLLRLHSKDCNTIISNSCPHPLLEILMCTLYFFLFDLSYYFIGCSKNWCLMCELEQYASTLRESGGPLSPSRILSNLRNIGCRLGGGTQEDAHEFLRYCNCYMLICSCAFWLFAKICTPYYCLSNIFFFFQNMKSNFCGAKVSAASKVISCVNVDEIT
jgi:hypothetical protein